MMKSCDVYFYNVGVELGVDRIAKYATMLGLGQKLGVGLNMEMPGLVPTTAWKKLTFRAPWTATSGAGALLLLTSALLALVMLMRPSGRSSQPSPDPIV